MSIFMPCPFTSVTDDHKKLYGHGHDTNMTDTMRTNTNKEVFASLVDTPIHILGKT